MENSTKIREDIGNFIKLRYIGTPKESLYIRFEDLIKYLLKYKEMRFSAALFEDLLKKEIENKILGRPMTVEVFHRMCDYIWELGLYCTHEKVYNEQRTKKIISERARIAREKRSS